MSTLKLTDEQIIKRHDPSCRGRAYIELQIINALIEQAAKHSYILQIREITLDDYDGDFKTAAFDLDYCCVDVINSSQEGIGWIRLVFGNDGWDLISDYSVNLNSFLKPVNELADFWGA